MISLGTTKPHFRVSPAVLAPLGIEQLQDPALAVLELIKNSWDADAKRVKVAVDQQRHPGRILVNDDGHGMTLEEFRDRWLVIGSSYKRSMRLSEGGRPLIGEKGLGRLASFALGNTISIKSARKTGEGFRGEVNWAALSSSESLEDYEVKVSESKVRKGTFIAIENLKSEWTNEHTQFLVTHAQFLASVPGQQFRISLRVNGQPHPIEDAGSTIDRLATGFLEVIVGSDGKPLVETCVIEGVDESRLVYREMKREERDPRLAGSRISLKFFLRDEAKSRLRDVLARNEIVDVLERYQGVRVFRDGINVPPYGLNGDDWAGLEKQRTATGGPTMVPGNSQLLGEVHVSRTAQPHLIITAGRSGFADQSAVGSLADYVRWAVRALGTARRAQYLGIADPNSTVPSRVDEAKHPRRKSKESKIRTALAHVSDADAVKSNPSLRRHIEEATEAISETLIESEETLRLYAQLASTGIAATSLSHEMRADFDVVSEAVEELTSKRRKPDKELIELLNGSWARIRAFAGLFKVIPVKVRRQRKTMSATDLRNSAKTILGLAPPDKIQTTVVIPSIRLRVIPAELDSILLNLVSNAVKAIDESRNRSSGRIRVTYASHGLDVRISVADNGCGLTPKVLEIAFEPLEGRFAEGTGMGLPIVKYIAERYKGSVTVSSPPPSGFATEFVVTLRNVVQ